MVRLPQVTPNLLLFLVRSAALPREAGKRAVLSCRSGKRSLTALGLAQAAGRHDVRAHFEGGMLAWIAAGEPVEI